MNTLAAYLKWREQMEKQYGSIVYAAAGVRS